MNPACWICGAEADSAEHRLKKSDLVRAHGKGPYIDSSALSHIRNGKETLIQGPGSKHVKYLNGLKIRRVPRVISNGYAGCIESIIWKYTQDVFVIRLPVLGNHIFQSVPLSSGISNTTIAPW